MASFDVEIETGRFRAAIDQVILEERHASLDMVEKYVDNIATGARRLAPRLKRPDRRFYPGELADSIRVERTSETSWFIAAFVRWAAYVEFGTAEHGRAQPYLRPAVALASAAWRLMR